MGFCKSVVVAVIVVCLSACNSGETLDKPAKQQVVIAPQLKINDALTLIDDANSQLRESALESAHAAWLASTYINVDSQFVEALANERYTNLSVAFANRASQYNELELDASDRRQLELLKQDLVLPAPKEAGLSKELAKIGSRMQAMYGEGGYCRASGECLSLEDMNEVMATSRDSELLKEVWQGWRTVSAPMRPLYQRQTEIANQGAQSLGYKDLSEMWRSKYDMPADEFSADIDKQWRMVKPFYDALHCHARARLNDVYGDDIVDPTGPIPAHLLGNMWAQTWGNVYDLLKPVGADRGYDLKEKIIDSGMTELDMVKIAEQFFVSLGFEPLPETFWQRSLFVKPNDREVVCHASAWSMDGDDDLRIKMCIKRNAEDFETIHHELGHNFYQRAYKDQPYLFQGSANDGFHEALGDTISLSVNPKYLTQIGLLDKEPGIESDLGYLMEMALTKIAFLPFGMMVDKWRWQVFSGEVAPQDYNKAWWQLRNDLQGIAAPVTRSEADFDPGAKYHIPGNTPYARYFLAFIQQFQFHRALCDTIGHQGPLHRCSIYNNKNAGEKLNAMMKMGKSQPWPAAMEALTGQPDLDASAIVDYFAPLKTWLDKQNEDRQCGWQ